MAYSVDLCITFITFRLFPVNYKQGWDNTADRTNYSGATDPFSTKDAFLEGSRLRDRWFRIRQTNVLCKIKRSNDHRAQVDSCGSCQINATRTRCYVPTASEHGSIGMPRYEPAKNGLAWWSSRLGSQKATFYSAVRSNSVRMTVGGSQVIRFMKTECSFSGMKTGKNNETWTIKRRRL